MCTPNQTLRPGTAHKSKTHLQFYKRYLQVNNKASNVACRAELGRLPLNITISKKSSTTLYIFSLKMKNPSLSNLLKCHLIYNVMVRVAFTLDRWRCQNILTYLTSTLIC